MDPTHRDLLRRTRMELARDMNADVVSSHLYSDEIFTDNDRDVIRAEVTPQSKNEKLLDILTRKGPKAFESFSKALKATTPHLSVKLSFDNGDETVSADNPLDAMDYAPPVYPSKQTTDTIDGPPTASTQSHEGQVRSDIKDKPTLYFDGRLSGIFKAKEVESKPSQYPTPDYPPSESHKSDYFYRMDTHPRGVMVIINNRDFLPSSGMEAYPRNGTDVDASKLEQLFIDLGFVVQPYKNLSVYEMRKVLKQTAQLDFTKYSCLACSILSHGQEGVIYGTDATIDIRELTGYFRGSNLAGKPKLFFFQACQGSDYMDSVDATDGPADDRTNDISLPSESDFLFAYSTVPGYYSWRNSANGSWFMQAIVSVFRENAHKMDILRMMTRVNAIVATKKSQTGQRASHNKRQISSIISQLRKELFFFPPKGALSG